MQKKSTTGSEVWIDPDDAPQLTTAMLDRAEVFDGNIFVRRGRGRPSTGVAKELVTFRLDRDVLAKLREAGPGWQSRVSDLLRGALKPETTETPLEPAEDAPIDVTLVRLNRSLTAERSAGISVKSGVVRVDYPLGSFELTVKTDSWSNAAIETAISDQLHTVGRALAFYPKERIHSQLMKATKAGKK